MTRISFETPARTSKDRRIRGRGAAGNPPNRFERLHLERDVWDDPDDPGARTQFLRDTSRSIIVRNDSPDVPFEFSINPYRGCEHGCIYCYARPGHEYLGYSAGLDFETRILVKERAPELLRDKLSSPRWKPQALVISGVTDPYQPIERRLQLTRRCLQVLAECRHPVSVITKNRLVIRDIDLFARLAAWDAALVTLSITTLDEKLQRIMEPRTSSPALRLRAVEELAEAGVPVGVNIAPVIPGLTDEEVPRILQAAADAGAGHAAYILVRLPHGVAELFVDWLERNLPGRKNKVLGRIREARGGKLYDPTWGERMRGTGDLAETIGNLFEVARRRAGLQRRVPPLSTAAFRRPDRNGQLDLFGEPANR